MSTDSQDTKWQQNISENFNRLSRVHERYRQTTDRRAIAYSERRYAIARRSVVSVVCLSSDCNARAPYSAGWNFSD